MPPRKPKLNARTADYVLFYTTDDLRREWRAIPGGGAEARTGLRDDVSISRTDLEAEIRWRVWWERFGYRALVVISLIAACAAVVAAIEGALPTGTSSVVQSPSGGSVVPVLALVVAILAVFFGPLVARANTQRQIRVTTRENWMREFREQVAGLRSAHLATVALDVSVPALPDSRLTEAMRSAQHNAAVWHHLAVIDLLIAEKGDQYAAFNDNEGLKEAGEARADLDKIHEEAAYILRRERAAMADDPGVWREVWISLGLDAVAWPSWSRRPPQGGPDLP